MTHDAIGRDTMTLIHILKGAQKLLQKGYVEIKNTLHKSINLFFYNASIETKKFRK